MDQLGHLLFIGHVQGHDEAVALEVVPDRPMAHHHQGPVHLRCQRDKVQHPLGVAAVLADVGDLRQDQGLVFLLFLAHLPDEEIPGSQDGFGIFFHAPVGTQLIDTLAQGMGEEALLVQPVLLVQFQGDLPQQFQGPGHFDGLEHNEGDPGDEILPQQLFGFFTIAHVSPPIDSLDTAAGDAAAHCYGPERPKLPDWSGPDPLPSGFRPGIGSGEIPAGRGG